MKKLNFVGFVFLIAISVLIWVIYQDNRIEDIKLNGHKIEVTVSDAELEKCNTARGSNRHLLVSDKNGKFYKMIIRKNDCKSISNNKTFAYYLNADFCVHSSYTVSKIFRPISIVIILILMMSLLYHFFIRKIEF